MEKSEYYDAFAAIMKITLRDGNATEEEKHFLQVFGRKLGITESEYFEIKDSYMNFEIVAPYTHNSRLESFYKIVEIVYNDDSTKAKAKTEWLERMGVALGFNPSNITYIVAKSLDVFENEINLESYKEAIKSMNK